MRKTILGIILALLSISAARAQNPYVPGNTVVNPSTGHVHVLWGAQDTDLGVGGIGFNPASPGAIGGTTPAAGTFTTLATGSLGSYVLVDGTKYARTAAGIQAAFTALGSSPGTVLLTPGTYAFGTTSVTLAYARQSLLCFGPGVCKITYNSTGTGGVAVAVNPSHASEIDHNEIGGLLFDGTGDTTNQKIAIQFTDTNSTYIHDISVQNWTGNSSSATTPSIGIDSHGRQENQIARIYGTMDRPINIDIDPASAITSDVYHLYDINVTPLSTESCVNIVPGSVVKHFTMDGSNTCSGGVSAFNWVDTTAVGASQNINISNFEHESATDATKYSFNIVRSNAGASYIYQFICSNCQASNPTANGFFVQRTFNALLIDPLSFNASGTSINADSTNWGTKVIGGYLNSTITNNSGAGTVTGGDYTQFQGLGAFGVQVGDGATATPSLSFVNAPTSGFFQGGGNVTLTIDSNNYWLFGAGINRQRYNNMLGWVSGDPNASTMDINFSRSGAGVLQLGTGETANALGQLNLGTMNIASLPGESTGDIPLCLSTGKDVHTAAVTCGTSAFRFKERITPSPFGLDTLMKWEPDIFYYKRDQFPTDEAYKAQIPMLGLIADPTAAADPKLFGAYNKDGELENYRDRAVLATAVKSIQEQQVEISDLKAEIQRLESDLGARAGK